MATKTEKTEKTTKKAKKQTVGAYPFVTKRQILERLDNEPGYVVECLGVLAERHAQKSPGMGFMSSHSATALKLVAKVADGELNDEETEQARSIVRRYTKQLAAHARAEQINSNPELAKVAEVFSAG
jgi:hypothetical protein